MARADYAHLQTSAPPERITSDKAYHSDKPTADLAEQGTERITPYRPAQCCVFSARHSSYFCSPALQWSRTGALHSHGGLARPRHSRPALDHKTKLPPPLTSRQPVGSKPLGVASLRSSTLYVRQSRVSGAKFSRIGQSFRSAHLRPPTQVRRRTPAGSVPVWARADGRVPLRGENHAPNVRRRTPGGIASPPLIGAGWGHRGRPDLTLRSPASWVRSTAGEPFQNVGLELPQRWPPSRRVLLAGGPLRGAGSASAWRLPAPLISTGGLSVRISV
jgi:hypothetical protein